MESKTLFSRYKALNLYWKVLIWFCLFFVFYVLFGFLGIPRIVRYVLVDVVPESIHRRVEVGEIAFNPFRLELNISNLSIKSRLKGKDFVKIGGLDLDIEAVSLPKRALVVSKLQIERPHVFLERDKKGCLNIEDLLGGEEGEAEAKGKKEEAPPKFSINNIEIKDGTLLFKDDLKGALHKVEKINIGIPFISDVGQNVKVYVKPYFSASFNGSPVAFKGQTRPFARDRDTKIHLRFFNIDVSKYLKYIPDYNGLRLRKGILSTNLAIHFFTKDKPRIVLSGNATFEKVVVAKNGLDVLDVGNIGLELEPSRLFSRHIVLKGVIKDVAVGDVGAGRVTGKKSEPAGKAKALLAVPAINVDVVDLDLAKGLVTMHGVALNAPSVHVLLDKDGVSNVQRLVDFIVGDAKKQESQRAVPDSSGEEGQSTVVRLLAFDINSAKVDYTDLSAPSPVRLLFSPLKCQVKNFSTAKDATFTYDVQSKVNRSGSFRVSGNGKLTGLNIDADLTLSKIPLPPFQGYVDRFLNAKLGRGNLSLSAKASFKEGGDSTFLNVKGNLRVQNVLLFDKETREPFVKWKEIAAKNFAFSYAPVRFVTDQILLNGVKQNIIITKDGSLNVAGLVKSQERKAPSNKGEEVESGAAKQPQVEIKTVKLVACRLRVVDKSLKQVFVREFDAIDGTINGLVNKPDMKAKVDVRALVDNRSRVSISGLVNPLAKPLFADLTVKIGGAGMTRFSPYAQKFLGYKIEKGKMFLDLRIKLEGNKLYVDNRLVLDQFDLGAQVPSKDAIHAPIKLAIALLKDRHGKIDLDIPVRGEIDDPEFSYRSAVLRAIMNIFVKAATSPFALLGSVLGSDEQLDTVAFPPGSSRLQEESRKKLDILAKALRDRPALKVEITGYYDPVADKEGLIEKKFMHLLKKEKFEDLSNDERERVENIDDLTIEPSEYDKYLEKAYKNASFKRPRNFIGMIKSQPKDVMERMIREHITVTESDLKNLASDRAKAVANYLVGQGKVAQERIFLVAPRGQQAQDKGKLQGVRLTLK